MATIPNHGDSLPFERNAGAKAITGPNICTPPRPDQMAQFQQGFAPRFLLTVDTEEEFDWGADFSRDQHSLDHVPRLARFQQFCEGEGVVPSYLIDWPIANSPEACEILGAAAKAGKADIGVQLHPWVNPPFEEEISQHNSFAGNLPRALEREKLMRLRDIIEQNVGVEPLIYRAGRYGVGQHSAELLKEAGIAIDTSVRPHWDYSFEGGPNYRGHPSTPYWVDQEKELLELPLTTMFWGMLKNQGSWIYPRMWRAPAMRGVLSKLALLERIPLTPEGVTTDEAIRGIDMALDDKLPLLILSFHSPSIHAGHTPYVKTEADLDQLYDWWRKILAYLRQRKVASTDVRDIMKQVIR